MHFINRKNNLNQQKVKITEFFSAPQFLKQKKMNLMKEKLQINYSVLNTI